MCLKMFSDSGLKYSQVNSAFFDPLAKSRSLKICHVCSTLEVQAPAAPPGPAGHSWLWNSAGIILRLLLPGCCLSRQQSPSNIHRPGLFDDSYQPKHKGWDLNLLDSLVYEIFGISELTSISDGSAQCLRYDQYWKQFWQIFELIHTLFERDILTALCD